MNSTDSGLGGSGDGVAVGVTVEVEVGVGVGVEVEVEVGVGVKVEVEVGVEVEVEVEVGAGDACATIVAGGALLQADASNASATNNKIVGVLCVVFMSARKPFIGQVSTFYAGPFESARYQRGTSATVRRATFRPAATHAGRGASIPCGTAD
jgi:hypothetical protein